MLWAAKKKKNYNRIIKEMSKIISEYTVALPHKPVVFKQILKSLKGFKNINVHEQTPKLNQNILDGTLPVIFVCLFVYY